MYVVIYGKLQTELEHRRVGRLAGRVRRDCRHRHPRLPAHAVPDTRDDAQIPESLNAPRLTSSTSTSPFIGQLRALLPPNAAAIHPEPVAGSGRCSRARFCSRPGSRRWLPTRWPRTSGTSSATYTSQVRSAQGDLHESSKALASAARRLGRTRAALASCTGRLTAAQKQVAEAARLDALMQARLQAAEHRLAAGTSRPRCGAGSGWPRSVPRSVSSPRATTPTVTRR